MQLEVITREPEGDARPIPILFVHGAWHGAWCWDEYFLPYFAQHGYLSYALSLRGHGASEGRERLRWTRLADYVADVAQVIEQIGKAPVLVGHSMGGMIVQKYLEKAAVPAAVLLAPTTPRSALRATLRLARRHPLALLKGNLTFSLYPAVSTPERAREALFSDTMPEEQVFRYFSRLQDESYLAYQDMLGLGAPRPKPTKIPILVLGVAQDASVPPDTVEALARALGTRAEIFPNMAHDMMLEPGWQAVADRIIEWLQEQGI